MNRFAKMLLTAAFASLPMALSAQTENPRGIYRMATLTGKTGEVKAPFEQYKICSDSITLTMSVRGSDFRFTDTDHKVFDYTGPEPLTKDSRETLIYDSNSEHFVMKWWSTLDYHLYFPKDDWCIEKYEASGFSETGRAVADALNARVTADKGNPLLGVWCVIGEIDELGKTKKQIGQLHERYTESRYFNKFMVFMPDDWVLLSGTGGGVKKIEYEGKNAYKIGGYSTAVKWLSKDCIALEERIDFRRDWIVLERMPDGVTPMSRIISQYVARSHRSRK